jgi:tetratricopeptide (TPR) repeat protein/thiol-disulfide isomerase/thioredoxin
MDYARRMRAHLFALPAIFALGCAETAGPGPASPVTMGPQAAPNPAPPSSALPPPATAAPASGRAAAPVRFIEGDIAGAAAKARAEGKALFVDAWAPWCHTCLSMKHFVLSDPALSALSDRVVFASIDTDRPEAAAFLAKHNVKAWPTFFVIDPASDKVVGYWAGSASLREMRALLEESVATMRGNALDPAGRAFAAARAAHGAGDLAAAAQRYKEALAAAPPAWPNRGAAYVGWIESLAGAKAWSECAAVGQAHAAEVNGSSAPGDFASYLLSCAEKLPAGPEQAAARKAAVTRLQEITARPPADASVDDRQDAYATLAEGLEALGDAAGARAAQEARVALLEQAARAARSPMEAQTFDYARAGAYVALGRGEEAVKMLTQRERELPDSYEPPARLAGVLYKMGKMDDALAAVDRAIARAYGPRKLRYLKLRADILAKKGDHAGALAAVRDEVKGWESLAPGQASPEQLAEAKRRLEEAEKKATR